MSPLWKFTLGRVGLCVLIGALLWPTGLHILVIAMAALLGSFLLSFVVLKKWRTEMLADVDEAVKRRRAQKEELRSALAGEDE
ncbi:DUF4229 domain-containing protein [Stackebrandtia nassauensis]|uniref:DUF4229 domain-containing protein n=1 Tax=Stackebrandtia nassauensis (strain DSM 44728 / CIP 108903 / NRRL B-16338 / NBRC 102104 / LLR-40K-21) TaxID=446470 RepID=D3Q604_STANL|nr:DUF4229 domain-containing protein [Stackebrandtia nassauensis]ADD40303.1 hypothetical protein Snas_0589 [Stackebrandtia nassauensis DSM 44728]